MSNANFVTNVEPLSMPGLARQLTATTASSNTALSSGIFRISMRAKGCDIRYAVGNGTQTANASTIHLIANGERLDIAVPPAANIAVIRETGASVDGTLEVSELT